MTYTVSDGPRGRRFGTLLLSAAIVTASFAVAPQAASGGTAPACIHRFASNKYREVGITNECGKTMGVKVIINWGRDSPCFVLFPQSIQNSTGALEATPGP
jgi:hypothetical protein